MDRYDDGKYFIINPDTRKVTVPVKYSSVIGDNGSQIFTFSIKRYIDGYDIMDCNDVTIHYDIVSEENGSKLYSDVYQCDDLRVSETDENIVYDGSNDEGWSVYPLKKVLQFNLQNLKSELL